MSCRGLVGRGTRHVNTRGQSVLAWLIGAAQLWFLFCMFGGRSSEMFRSASDRLEDVSTAVAFTIVNPAFHLTLIVAATFCFYQRSQRATGIGIAVAALNAIVILAHLVTSLAIA